MIYNLFLLLMGGGSVQSPLVSSCMLLGTISIVQTLFV